MWLLGSTSEGDKKGLSDYFQSPLKVAMQGGSRGWRQQQRDQGGGNDLTQSAGQAKRGDGADRKSQENVWRSGKRPRPPSGTPKMLPR
jgi:chemotaxis protein MotB